MCTKDLMIAGQIFVLIYLSKYKFMKAMNISIRLNSTFHWFKVGQHWDYTMSLFLTFVWSYIVLNFLTNQLDALVSQIYSSWNETLHVLDSSSVPPIRSFPLYTQQWCMSYRFAESLQAGLGFHPDPAHKLSANLYDIYHCCVYSEKLQMMDSGTVQNM